jgi:hypothetical protein
MGAAIRAPTTTPTAAAAAGGTTTAGSLDVPMTEIEKQRETGIERGTVMVVVAVGGVAVGAGAANGWIDMGVVVGVGVEIEDGGMKHHQGVHVAGVGTVTESGTEVESIIIIITITTIGARGVMGRWVVVVVVVG